MLAGSEPRDRAGEQGERDRPEDHHRGDRRTPCCRRRRAPSVTSSRSRPSSTARSARSSSSRSRRSSSEITDPDEPDHARRTRRRRSIPRPRSATSCSSKLSQEKFGRIAAQAAKQNIIQRVRDAERDIIYNEFKDRKGELFSGIVQRFETQEHHRQPRPHRRDPAREGADPARALPPGRSHPRLHPRRRADQQGAADRALAHPSRACSIKLFEQEVPEIYEGIVEVKGAAREPGGRAKIAVDSNDRDVDPVGACVGMRGTRVQSVVQELRGEKIDIVPWTPDPAEFVCRALAPAKVSKIIMDEDERAHGGDRPRRSAVARHRQEGAERPPRVAAHRLASSTCAARPRPRTRRGTRARRSWRCPGIGDVTAELLYQNGFKSAEELAASDVETVGEVEAYRAEATPDHRVGAESTSSRSAARGRGGAGGVEAAAAAAAAARSCRGGSGRQGMRSATAGADAGARGGVRVSEPIRTCVGCADPRPAAGVAALRGCARRLAARRRPAALPDGARTCTPARSAGVHSRAGRTVRFVASDSSPAEHAAARGRAVGRRGGAGRRCSGDETDPRARQGMERRSRRISSAASRSSAFAARRSQSSLTDEEVQRVREALGLVPPPRWSMGTERVVAGAGRDRA